MAVARPIGTRVKNWFTSAAEHVTAEFFPDSNDEPLAPGEGYVRLWLAEGFLAQRTKWGNHYFPALYGGVTLTFANQSTPFTRFTDLSATSVAPGPFLDYPMTTLLPYIGGILEIEAALYKGEVAGPLSAAVAVAGSVASLIGPPLTIAATIAERVSNGLDTVLDSQQDSPVLGLHWTLVAPGGGGQVLRPGYLIVVNASPEELPDRLHIEDGRLRRGGKLLTQVDYLVLRVECRRERDELHFPEFDQLLAQATTEYLVGNTERFEGLRVSAISQAMTSPDLIPSDRRRLAKYAADRFDEVKDLGAVPADHREFDPIPANRFPGPEEVKNLTLGDLITN